MADVDIIPHSCVTVNGMAPRSSVAGLYGGINISPERHVTADVTTDVAQMLYCILVPRGILVSIGLCSGLETWTRAALILSN